jgi:hypothetical protein
LMYRILCAHAAFSGLSSSDSRHSGTVTRMRHVSARCRYASVWVCVCVCVCVCACVRECVCVCVCVRARYLYTHTPTAAHGHGTLTCKVAKGRVETCMAVYTTSM